MKSTSPSSAAGIAVGTIDVPISIGEESGNVDSQGFRNGKIDGRTRIGAIVRAGFQLNPSPKLGFGSATADKHRAANAVASTMRKPGAGLRPHAL